MESVDSVGLLITGSAECEKSMVIEIMRKWERCDSNESRLEIITRFPFLTRSHPPAPHYTLWASRAYNYT